MLDTLRAFVAVNLDIAAARRVIALQRALRASSEAPTEKIAWVPPANLHIGIRTFGHIDAAFAPAIADALRALVRELQTAFLTLVGPTAFPRKTQARLLLVDASAGSSVLRDLTERVDKLATSVGLELHTKPFSPHIVLARLSQPVDATSWFASMGRAEPFEATATECVLYDGATLPAGAEYRALARIVLTGSAHQQRSQRPRQTRKSLAPATPALPAIAAAPAAAPAVGVSQVAPSTPLTPKMSSKAPADTAVAVEAKPDV